MGKIEYKEINEKDIWENFVINNHGNFLQSWYWGDLNEGLGNKIIRYGYFQNNKLIGICQLIRELSKRANYVVISAGPIINWDNQSLIEVFKQSVINFAKENNCVFIRCRPQQIDSQKIRSIFKTMGYRSAPMHLEAELTLQINLNQSEDQLLSQMRKQTRYEIKKAIKLGIDIKISNDPSGIKLLYDIQLQTAKRQHFIPFSYQRLHQQFKIFGQNNYVKLYSAYFKDKLLAMALVIFYNHEAVYHYGASTIDGRNYPGAYLIQWQVIKDAKKQGCQIYNLWGVAPENQKSHRFYNLSVFKRGFGGEEVNYLHAQDLVINKPRYLINWVIETARRKMRKL